MDLSIALAASLHLMPGDYNALHPSVRFEHDGWSVGATMNSERRLSLVAGYRWQGKRCWAELGAATGYSAAPVIPWNRAGCRVAENVDLWGAVGATVKRDVGLVVGVEFTLH